MITSNDTKKRRKTEEISPTNELVVDRNYVEAAHSDQPIENTNTNTENAINDGKNEETKNKELFNNWFKDINSLKIPISWNRRQTEKGDFSAIELTETVTRKVIEEH